MNMNSKQLSSVTLITVLSILCVSACAVPPSKDDPLIGKWQTNSGTFEFFPDGKVHITTSQETVVANYSKVDDTHIEIVTDSDSIVLEYKVSADVLSMSDGTNSLRLLKVSTAETSPISSSEKDLYEHRILVASDQRGSFDIYIVDGMGNNLVLLTSDFVNSHSPAWSPDGRKIAFISGPQYLQRYLYVMNSDGSNAIALTDDTLDSVDSPAWSPSGEKIAFSAENEQGDIDIFIISADGSDFQKLPTTDDEDFAFVWSPDSKRIAFSSGDQVFIINSDGSNLRQLTNALSQVYFPKWSPDGKFIVAEGNSEVVVINVENGSVHSVANELGGETFAPDWSPNGLHIALQARINGKDEIYVINSDGSNPRRLTNNDNFNFAPVWSPDGKYIAYSSSTGSFSFDAYVMESNGSNPHLVARSISYSWLPAWKP